MRKLLPWCRTLVVTAIFLFLPAVAQAGGLSDKFSGDPQIQNAIDTVESELESFATRGEATRGASGPMIQLLQSSDTLICSAWIISFRQELQRLVVQDFLDPPVQLIAAAQDLLSRVERACQGVLQPGTAVAAAPPAGTPPARDEPAGGQSFTPRPGWTIDDEICARRCARESAAVQRADWAKYDAESDERKSRAQLEKDERELTSERENLARAEARLESARADLNRREEFSRRIGPSADGKSNADLDLHEARTRLADATRDLPLVRNRAALREQAAAASRAALDRAVAARQRAEREAAEARAALERCLRDCRRQSEKGGDKSSRLDDKRADSAKHAAEKERRVVNKDGEPPAKGGPGGKVIPDKRPDAGPDLRLELPRDKMGGGMQQIDPAPPRESILDSLDETPAHRGPAAGAACPDCSALAASLASQQADLQKESEELARQRKNYTDATAGRGLDRRTPEGADASRLAANLVAEVEAAIRRQAKKVADLEQQVDDTKRQLESCNRRCGPPPGGPGTALPAAGGAPAARCPACNDMARQQGEVTRQRQAKEGEVERLSREAQEISGRALDGKARPGDAGQLQERRRQIGRLVDEIADLDREAERLGKARQDCEKTSCPPPADGRKAVVIDKGAGGACAFPAAQPVIIGSREKFGYGGEQKAAEIGKAAFGLLGGLLGGRGGGGGGGSPFGGAGGDKPSLADDPIRAKQTFADPGGAAAIKVGAQYRPDGKLLVSIDVDKAEDKGVVHQASLERLKPRADGGCDLQVAEPVEWLHYEIWEDWWAKIRIQRYESVDGGPWRKTHDTGWRDWGSGSRLLESGTLPADQIPRTAWGSMGADRAFGGPRSAGALFDPGKPVVVGQPAPERLVVHVTQPGKDPVTTLPFTLYPTYGLDGKINYSDKMPDISALLKDAKLPLGGGMTQIDPPATGPAPRESILDSLD